MIDPHKILEFWFGALQGPEDYPEGKSKLWFVKDAENDRIIRERFGSAVEEALKQGHPSWNGTGAGRLALILLLDQFTRNIYRDDARAFAGDERALALCIEGVDRHLDRELLPVQRCFFYMPLEHHESIASQDRAVALFEDLLNHCPQSLRNRLKSFHDYALRHREVIRQFGRFPHRNEILGRETTAKEEAFLRQPGSGF